MGILHKLWHKGCGFIKFQFNPRKHIILDWLAKEGDDTFRQEYPLSEGSVVFDVGAYQGQWASDIVGRYNCQVYCFEPIVSFYERVAKRFASNPKIQVFPFGLLDQDRTCEMFFNHDGSSSHRKAKEKQPAKFKAAEAFIKDKGIKEIDLMKINIEGDEFLLLPHLIDSGMINNIENIQIQFHPFIKNAKAKMDAIRAELSKTHEPTYQYEFVWESWRRKLAS